MNVNFNQNDYSMGLIEFLKRINKNWLPIDKDKRNKENEFVNFKLTKNEALFYLNFS